MTGSKWRRRYCLSKRTTLTVKRMNSWRFDFRWKCWMSLWVGPWYFEVLQTDIWTERYYRRMLGEEKKVPE